jgi:TPR repeat protein
MWTYPLGMRVILAGGLLALVTLSGAAAGQLEDGGAAYDRGDYATAVQLWRPLAERGNAAAQQLLGTMYDQGRGVPQDFAQAVAWFRKAAGAGKSPAALSIGVMYDLGHGVPQDYVQAAKWFRKAADHGNAYAQNFLGLLYEGGQGVPQDYVRAHMWLNLAASSAGALDDVRGDATKSRDELAAKMTPDQIAEAQRMAREWAPK